MNSRRASYEIVPFPADTAAELRRAGGEVHVADESPGYPCRQCLRDAKIGDELILVSYDPFDSASPYRSASPIFLHRSDCGVPAGGSSLPEQLTRRQLSVRSFDAAEMMLDAVVIDGRELAKTIDDFFADQTSELLHVHNAERGCWAAAIAR